MEEQGLLAPETPAAVRERYDDLAPAAQTVTRELARAMDFDGAEYDRRVTGEVVATARDALFASLLVVRVGDREAFEDWRADTDHEVTVQGSEHVDGVVWHDAPAAEAAVAATFAEERAAAVATLRRQAFGSLYRPLLEDGGDEGGDGDGAEDGDG